MITYFINEAGEHLKNSKFRNPGLRMSMLKNYFSAQQKKGKGHTKKSQIIS